MPAFVLLLIIAVVALVTASVAPLPVEVRAGCRWIGLICLIIGIGLALWWLFVTSGLVHL